MVNPWFRLYAEFAHDPKVQILSEVMQRRYIMLMCMRCSNVTATLHETEIAFYLRISEVDLAETKALFIEKGFVDSDWNLLNWEKRQFTSDSSAARVSRHREKKKQDCNSDVTLQKRNSNALDTDADTDNKEKINKKEIFDPKKYLIEIGVDEKTAVDWMQHRKNKKAVVTARVIEIIRLEAQKAGVTLSDALEISCLRGWAGFDASWLKNEIKSGDRHEERKRVLDELTGRNRAADEQRTIDTETSVVDGS